jgi:hypothetical protein
MYLTEIDTKTGLLNIEDVQDGILAIKAFRDVIEDKKLGLPCLTAIALVVDHKSPIKHYSEVDKPRKAMEEVTGDRDRYVWNQDKIQLALIKYEDLQYNPTLEEKEIHYQRRVTKIKELKESEKKYQKKDADGELLFPDIKAPQSVSAELRRINEDVKNFELLTEGKDIYKGSPVVNNYTLSRLEQKLDKKNSFYNQSR